MPFLPLKSLIHYYPQSLNNVNSLAWTNRNQWRDLFSSSWPIYPNSSIRYLQLLLHAASSSRQYELPAVIANKSVNANLVFVEYLQRHHKRTPYNLFPNGGSTYWQCQNIQPYFFANARKDWGCSVLGDVNVKYKPIC